MDVLAVGCTKGSEEGVGAYMGSRLLKSQGLIDARSCRGLNDIGWSKNGEVERDGSSCCSHSADQLQFVQGIVVFFEPPKGLPLVPAPGSYFNPLDISKFGKFYRDPKQKNRLFFPKKWTTAALFSYSSSVFKLQS